MSARAAEEKRPMTRRGCYEPGRLSELLESRIGSDEEAAMARHLDRCKSCQATLEGLAADTKEWDAMRELLREKDDLEISFACRLPFDSGEGESLVEPESHLPAGLLAPSDDPAFLGRIGVYEVTGVIGRGGMSLVLKAFDRPLSRNVAIKVLAPQLAANAAARRRFAREARAAAAVVHEHVIPIYAVAEQGGLPYLVMPYYPARSLQKRIDDGGPLATAEVLRIARQVASGLAAAHAQGLVHRDVKPANILLEKGVERAVVSDFGLARAIDDASVTCSGTITGTPQYMAPEQARGDTIDHRADLFSLGSVIYAMCAGRPPFRAETTLGVLRRVCEEQPRPLREVNPDVPDWLADAIAKLHAKDPAERFATVREAEAFFEEGLAHVQSPTTASAPRRLRPGAGSLKSITGRLPRGQRRLLVGLVGFVVAIGLVWFGGTVSRSPRDGGNVRAASDRPSAPATSTIPAAAAPADVGPVGAGTAEPVSDVVEATDLDAETVRAHVRSIEAAWSASDVGGDPWGGEIARLREQAARLTQDE